jgi:zinc transport system substrate-binding protein
VRLKSTILSVLIVSGLFVILAGGCTSRNSAELKIVTTTSLLTEMVERVGGDRVEVANIIPPTQHPGDFDASPGDIQLLAEADLFLVHGWPGETFVPDLIASADNPDLLLVTIDVQGNWMTPPVQKAAVEKVAAALSEVDSRNASSYREAAAQYQAMVDAKETDIKARLVEANPSQVNVMGAFWQAGFLEWAGFNVIATYGDPDSLTPRVVQELVEKGREAGVTLIVDNLHSGKDAGKGLAADLDARRVILTNFPGGFDGTETWEKAIEYNVSALLEAVSN